MELHPEYRYTKADIVMCPDNPETRCRFDCHSFLKSRAIHRGEDPELVVLEQTGCNANQPITDAESDLRAALGLRYDGKITFGEVSIAEEDFLEKQEASLRRVIYG